MNVVKRRIGDGINLNIIETDKFKTNYISVNFLTPLKRETAALTALLPAVLKRGTQSYPDLAALNKRYDTLYSTYIDSRNYKRGETQIFGFAANMLDNRFATDGMDITGETLELMAEIMFKPALDGGCFNADYVESEKSNLIDAINAQINNKNYYAIRRCEEEMCRDELFSIQECGRVEDVEAVTPRSLYAFYKDVYNRAGIEIYFVGKTDFALLEERIRAIFAPISHTGGFKVGCEVIRAAGKVKEIVEDQPVAQGKLSLGFRTGSVLSDGDYGKFMMFCEIFGGSPASKLFMNVREKLSLCYYCSARPNSDKGIMIVASGIEVDNKQKAQDEILAQLENMKNGDFTDEEFTAALNSIEDGYNGISDSAGGLEAWYLGRMMNGLESSPEQTLEQIKKVTREDVVEAAKKVTLDTVYFMRGTLQQEDGSDENE